MKVGDKIPDISLGKMINYKHNTAKFSDFKGKIVILDFWATWCGGCVKALPDLGRMQEKFGDKIVIIPVSEKRSRDNEKGVMDFLKKHQLPMLPNVVEDEVLQQLFPHFLLPHDVWIDEEGTVVAMTSAKEVNEENIADLLAKKPLKMKVKKDNLDFSIVDPLLLDGNGGNTTRALYSAVLTERIDGIGGGNSYLSGDGKKGNFFMFQNADMYQMFFASYIMRRNFCPFNGRRTMVDTGGVRKLINEEEFYQKDGPRYCFSLSLPAAVSDSLFFRKYLLEEVNRFFPYVAGFDTVVVPALLVSKNRHHKPESILAHGDGPRKIIRKDGVVVRIENGTVQDIIDLLGGYRDTPPLINDTGYEEQKVTMDLFIPEEYNHALSKPMDLSVIRGMLGKYGFTVTEVNDRPVEVLVISKRK
ncbi:TlpA family protein disulfide reductase [Chitinophaga sp. Mgbs1]|uniref:TlpA family protein disulfide reductase n=1 Tax=Chitinophaga solisilvae TaxID=1233460 RepID=A0A9Q5GVP2_9BACT|nr:TlpA family protein disulfide reductase [Chitinophaga solisilvae]